MRSGAVHWGLVLGGSLPVFPRSNSGEAYAASVEVGVRINYTLGGLNFKISKPVLCVCV